MTRFSFSHTRTSTRTSAKNSTSNDRLPLLLVIVLVICANLNMNLHVSGFNVGLKSVNINTKSRCGLTKMEMGMLAAATATTGRRGKAASSKEEDLEKTVALILKHDEKLNESVTWKTSSLYSSSGADDDDGIVEATSNTAGSVEVDSDGETQSKKKGVLKRIGSKLKFWKK